VTKARIPFSRLIEGGPEVCGGYRREMEGSRQYSDDQARNPIESCLLAQHRRVGGEALLPGFVTQDNRLASIRLVFAGREVTAQHRNHTQGAKEAVTHPGSQYLFCT
jgi:hypothetical protein